MFGRDWEMYMTGDEEEDGEEEEVMQSGACLEVETLDFGPPEILLRFLTDI